MKNKRFYLILPLMILINSISYAKGGDDPLLTMIKIDQLEWREDSPDDNLVLEAQAWFGYDLNKLWLKTDLEHSGSDLEEAELQLLYSRAIAPFWDLQLGLRHDFKPADRNWAVIGFQGLAPYWFEIDSALFFGESGQVALRFEAEYELLLTQRLILTPEITINIYSKNDHEMGIGSGLSDMSAGLRLRYEIRREFAPYLGIQWSKKFGNTADLARDEGEGTGETQFVVGVRIWF